MKSQIWCWMDHHPFLGIDKYNCGVEHTIKDLHLLVGHKGSPVLEQKQKGEKLDDKYAQSSSRTGNKYSELNQISILGVTSQKLLEAYAKDNWLKKIKTCLKTKKLDPLLSNSLKLDKITIFWPYLHYNYPEGCKRFIVPNDETIKYHFFRVIHDSPIGGHLGLEKTMDKLFYWKNMQDDVIRYLQACQACQMVKSMNQSKFGLLQPLPLVMIQCPTKVGIHAVLAWIMQ